MSRLKLSTRSFLLSFIPVCLLLVTAFFAISRVTHERIRRELRESIYESARMLDRAYAEVSRDRTLLLGKLTDSAGLKASVGLLAETGLDPKLREQASATIEAQLAELQQSSAFSYLAIIDAQDRIIASLPPTAAVNRQTQVGFPRSGLAEINGALYELQSVPIEIGGETAATLTVGQIFDLKTLAAGGAAVLLKEGRLVGSTFSSRLTPLIAARLSQSCPQPESGCEVTVDKHLYVVSALQSAQLGHDYKVLVFRSLDASLQAFNRAFVPNLIQIGLCGMMFALLCTLATSRSVTRPLLALSSQLEEAALTGELPETLDSGQGVREIDLVAASFNRLSAAERRSRNELVEAKHAAEVANRLKTEFLNNVSHELKTPVNGIVGMAELMTITELSEEQRDYLDTIQSCSTSLTRLINEVLDFSELDTGRLRLRLSAVDVSSLLDDILAFGRSATVNKPISIELHVPDRLPESCLGDEKRIRQVLMHLCENAVKYTDRGFIRLSADFVQNGSLQGFLTFAVEDSGIGIAEENLDLVFQPFTQVDGSLTRQQGGTGVGLSVVKSLVGLMGGRFGVNSTLHVGSRFWFTLPVRLIPNLDANIAAELVALT